MNSFPTTNHIPVLLNEVLTIFGSLEPGEHVYLDGTFGRGGHARALLAQPSTKKVYALDWDHQAIEFAKEHFSKDLSSGRLQIERASYVELARLQADLILPKKFSGILLDLGVSSPQLDQAERGFSFYNDGPLDMRMDQRQELTAAEIINEFDEQELARIFIEYGEVFKPYRVVRALVHDRQSKPFTTTRELASLIERVDGWRKKGTHPATQYFLALRLAVNAELRSIEGIIPTLIESLVPGGIVQVITFHSLEDRIVKNLFKSSLEHGKMINKKVIVATDEELKINPRSRSAKLRAFRREPLESQPDRRTETVS